MVTNFHEFDQKYIFLRFTLWRRIGSEGGVVLHVPPPNTWRRNVSRVPINLPAAGASVAKAKPGPALVALSWLLPAQSLTFSEPGRV